MKKSLLITTIFFAFLINVTAQKNGFSVGLDVLGYANEYEEAGSYRAFTLGYERAISKRFTANFKGSIKRSQLIGTHVFNLRRKVKNAELGINFYPKRAHRGIYLGLAVTRSKLDFALDGENPPNLFDRPDRFYGAGVNMGLNIKLSKRIYLGVDTGAKVLQNFTTKDQLLQVSGNAKIGFTF